jgi:hypothetical protein
VNNFIGTLVEQSIETKAAIQPRVTGKFETPRHFANEFAEEENLVARNNDIGEPDTAFNEKKIQGHSAQKDEQTDEESKLYYTDKKNNVSDTVLDRLLIDKNEIASAENALDKSEKNITSLTPLDPKGSLLSDFFYKEGDSGKAPDPWVNNNMGEPIQFNSAKDPINEDLQQLGQKRNILLTSSGDPEILPPGNFLNAKREEEIAADHRLDLGSIKMNAAAFPGQEINGSTKTVNVHIGRIEVRVVQPAAENRQKTKAHTGSGVEEFLNKRNGLHK